MMSYYVRINDAAYRFHGSSCTKITLLPLLLLATFALNCLWFFTPPSSPLRVDVNDSYSSTLFAHRLPQPVDAVVLDETHHQSAEVSLSDKTHQQFAKAVLENSSGEAAHADQYAEDALARENHRRSVKAARSAIARNFCSSLAEKGRNISTCDFSRGKWVRDTSPPLYTNETCRYIYPNQDCMTNGRPDRDFLHWKWQPNDCELPSFNATEFLASMMGKRMVFVGDSLARNHMQALLCALAQVEDPQDQHAIFWNMAYAWYFPSYNFSLALSWAPFLVNFTVDDGIWKLHLDRPDTAWTSTLANYDIAIFSTLHWYFRSSIYYVNNQTFSSYDAGNGTSIEDLLHAIEVVWNTVLNYLLDNYRGVAIVRTVTVSHFADNPWNKGGTCNKTQPDLDPDMQMQIPWLHSEIRNKQINELNKALARQKSDKLVKPTLRLIDVTYSTLLRPDAHPGTYRIQNPSEPRHDCTHWCQPGAIDTWNQILFADPQVMCWSADVKETSDFRGFE